LNSSLDCCWCRPWWFSLLILPPLFSWKHKLKFHMLPIFGAWSMNGVRALSFNVFCNSFLQWQLHTRHVSEQEKKQPCSSYTQQ
jgi:hypothetical protein